MQVMIAQNGDCGFTESFDIPQGCQRVGTAVYQIAGKPEAVFSWVKSNMLEQFL